MRSVRRLLDRSVGAVQQGVLLAFPHGGQRVARGNAWRAVQAGGARRADRLSAMRAVTDLELPLTERPAYAAAGR